jgi:hypothetical protein
VLLPFHPDSRRVGTGLARASAAVVTWLTTAYPDEVQGVIGDVPARLMAEIQLKLVSQSGRD